MCDYVVHCLSVCTQHQLVGIIRVPTQSRTVASHCLCWRRLRLSLLANLHAPNPPCPCLHVHHASRCCGSLKNMEGRQGRRFSLINLRSSSSRSKSVSLSPTVTVLTPSASPASPSSEPASPSSAPLSVTHFLSPDPGASRSASSSSSPQPSEMELKSSPTLCQLIPSPSTTLQLVTASSTLERVPSTSASCPPLQLQLSSPHSTFQLLPGAEGSSPTLQLVPASTAAATLQLVPSVSTIHRQPSTASSSVQRIPSTSSQPKSSPVPSSPLTATTVHKVCRSASQISTSGSTRVTGSPELPLALPSSKLRTRKVPRKTSLQLCQCSRTRPHSSHGSTHDSPSECLLEPDEVCMQWLGTYSRGGFVSLV